MVKILALTHTLMPSLHFQGKLGQRIFLVGKLSFKRIA